MQISRAVPILTVDDLPSSVATYSELLGCDILMDLGWIVTLGSGSGQQFSLMETDQTAPVNPAVSIDVEDVDHVHEATVRAGVSIVHPLTDEDWGVRRFFFRDPSGNVVNVLTHLR